MGIDPIRYKPWAGSKAGLHDRIFVMARTFFMKKVRSKGILAILILGYIGVWAFPIIINSLMPHESLEGSVMAGHMGDGLLFIFTVLLVSLVCSDSISEDLRSNSFVLYFSRALRKESYLTGKILGCFMIMAMFCMVPAIVMAVAIMGTQTGDAYLGGMKVVAQTVLAGFFAAAFLIPLAVMMSSLTSRKSFAAVGTFMVLLVLTIVANIFAEFNDDWRVLDPSWLLSRFYKWIYGINVAGPNGILASAFFIMFMVLPMAALYLRIHLKEAGK